ncbi:MAG TPA: hypothetical protein DD856_03430 [Sulfobacillus sp.]|nr:hypothetical protein [Sulfobacillus sp.]
MRAKLAAVIAMALVATFAWVRYHIPFVHVPAAPVITSRISPAVSLKKLGKLPAVSSKELQLLIDQGLVYGMHIHGTNKTVLFLARTPNAPATLIVRHWPPERFAPIRIMSHPYPDVASTWHQDQKRIHWLRLSPQNFR